MNAAPVLQNNAQLVAEAEALRPQLHRYCSRLMGSVIDGEDVVQDALERALTVLAGPGGRPENLRSWLFRIAHNRAMDLLRARRAAPFAAGEPPDSLEAESMDPLAAVLQQEAVEAAVARFAELSPPQRSVVALKDVLDEPLSEISGLLGVSVDAVKAHLARGRRRLRALGQEGGAAPPVPEPSPELTEFTALFNRRDWARLRALLADDVRLVQGGRPARTGRGAVSKFFDYYAQYPPVRLTPGWLEGREVAIVQPSPSPDEPDRRRYFMWLQWRGGRITFIRDYRYVRYVGDEVAATRPLGARG